VGFQSKCIQENFNTNAYVTCKTLTHTIHGVAEEKTQKTILSKYLSIGQEPKPKPPNTLWFK
jgi:hypothetical protein